MFFDLIILLFFGGQTLQTDKFLKRSEPQIIFDRNDLGTFQILPDHYKSTLTGRLLAVSNTTANDLFQFDNKTSTSLLFQLRLFDSSSYFFSVIMRGNNFNINEVGAGLLEFLNQLLAQLSWANNTISNNVFPELLKIQDMRVTFNATYKYGPIQQTSTGILIPDFSSDLGLFINNGYYPIVETKEIFQRILTIDNYLKRNVTGSLITLYQLYSNSSSTHLIRNLTNMCNTLSWLSILFGNMAIPQLQLTTNYQIFQSTVCNFVPLPAGIPLLNQIGTFLGLPNSNMTVFNQTNNTNTSLGPSTSTINNVAIFNIIDNFNINVQIYNLTREVSYTDGLTITLPFQILNSPLLTSSFTIPLPPKLWINFNIPSTIANIRIVPTSNCILPIFLVGRNLIPTLSLNNGQFIGLDLYTSKIGIPTLQNGDIGTLSVANFSDPSIINRNAELYSQTIDLSGFDVSDNLTGLFSCLDVSNSGANNPQITVTTSARKISTSSQSSGDQNNTQILTFTFLIFPGQQIEKALPDTNYSQTMVFNSTNQEALKLVIDYSIQDFSGTILWLPINKTNTISWPAAQNKVLTAYNTDPNLNMILNIQIGPTPTPLSSYISIVVGVVVGFAGLAGIGLAVFCIIKRRKQKKKEDNMDPRLTSQILLDLSNNYVPIIEFVNNDPNRNKLTTTGESTTGQKQNMETGEQKDVVNYAVLISNLQTNIASKEPMLNEKSNKKTDVISSDLGEQ